MALKLNGLWCAAFSLTVAGLAAQAPTPAPPEGQSERPPTFSVHVELVTDDVVVRDGSGHFVPDLKKDEFEIFEDGVRQDITSMTVVTGGRVTNLLAPPPPSAPEGIILPPARTADTTSGRIFLFFVDDLHLEFKNTPRIRQLFKQLGKNLLHEGDMWGMVSSGTSSIAIDMTYNRKQFDEAVDRIKGSELSARDIIQGPAGEGDLKEVRYRAQVAFQTVHGLVDQLAQVHSRRKALVYVSDGYDFNPYQNSRYATNDSPFEKNEMAALNREDNSSSSDSSSSDSSSSGSSTTQAEMSTKMQGEEFSDAELASDMWDLTEAANRANTTIYTLDPRGLVAPLGDIEYNVDPQEWQSFVMKTQDSLRAMAEQTGGIAVVNTNDFDKAIKRIDAETSDYYVIGYYSSNPDPLRKRRRLEVKVTRDGMNIWSRKEYVLKPTAKSSQR
jgi:VWFA-related protein